MFLFILAIILFAIGIIAAIVGFTGRYGAFIVTGITAVIGIILLIISTWWANGQGEAKVMVNGIDRQFVGTIEEPSSGFKPAWVDFVSFDLFNQELVYAGGKDGAPSYTGGTVNGGEVTVTTGGVNGGSTQANVDISISYSIAPSAVKGIYEKYRTQERFTQQVVERTILSITRAVPAEYTAIEFRGPKRTEAADKITQQITDRLGEQGVQDVVVNIQDVRFSEAVEKSLTQIEEANQAAEKAEAEKRTAEVQAETQLVKAKAEADANRVISESLTPEVLEQRRIDALTKAAEKGNLIIDGGNSGILLNR